jgi:hypothetical protein
MMEVLARNKWIAFGTAAIVSAGVAIAVSRPALQAFIEDAGVNIPTGDVVVDYATGMGWAFVLLLSILVWPVPSAHKRMLVSAWILKCFVALAVMLPYEQRYYGLDCWTYFQQAHAGLAEIVPRLGRGGSEVVEGLGALHLIIGPDSYHAMKLSFAMFGLVAVYLLYRSAELMVGEFAPLFFWGLMLYPSVLFWSSILGKDPVILAGIALHVWGLVNVVVRGRNGYLVAVLAGIGAVSAIRIWMGPILILPCLLILGARIKHIAWRATAVILVGLALLSLAPLTADRLELDKASDLFEATRNVSRGWDRANSSIQMDGAPESLWDLVLFTPESMFIAYFRPLPGDVPNLFGWFAGFENLVLLAVSIWALLRVRLIYFRQPLFLWSLALLLSWGLAYSILSYKDLGSAARYKLQILPILLGVIGFLLRQPSISRPERLASRAGDLPLREVYR